MKWHHLPKARAQSWLINSSSLQIPFLSLTCFSHSPQCISTLLMLVTSDIYTLINYVGFINYLFYGVTIAGQIVLRWKKPDIPRPIKVGKPLREGPPPTLPLLVLAAAQIFQSPCSQLLTIDHLYDGNRPFGKQSHVWMGQPFLSFLCWG